MVPKKQYRNTLMQLCVCIKTYCRLAIKVTFQEIRHAWCCREPVSHCMEFWPLHVCLRKPLSSGFSCALPVVLAVLLLTSAETSLRSKVRMCEQTLSYTLCSLDWQFIILSLWQVDVFWFPLYCLSCKSTIWYFVSKTEKIFTSQSRS